MIISAKKIAALTAVAALSGFALIGCSADNISSEPSSNSSAVSKESTEKATPASAADFVNKFNEKISVGLNPEDFSDKAPPVTLNEAQSKQMMSSQKVDGVSEAQLKELADFIYDNYPLGDFLYFAEDANTGDRIKVLVNLVFLQSLGAFQSEEVVTATVDDIVVEKSDDGTVRASTQSGDVKSLIFVDNEWKFDGAELAKTLDVDLEGNSESTDPILE